MIHQDDHISHIKDVPKLLSQDISNANFTGTLTRLSDVKTSDSGKVYRFATIRDDTGEIDLRLLGEKCYKFTVGEQYKLENAWMNVYKDTAQLNIGDTCHVEQIVQESAHPPPQQTLDDPEEHMTVHYSGKTNIIDDDPIIPPQIDDKDEQQKAAKHVIDTLNFLKTQGYNASDDALVATINTLLIAYYNSKGFTGYNKRGN